MFHIEFLPVRMDATLQASVLGEVLTLNGEAFDLGPLPDGAVLSATHINSPWLAGQVTRISGVIHVTLILPNGANAADETRFPASMAVGDGPIDLPVHDTAGEVAG